MEWGFKLPSSPACCNCFVLFFLRGDPTDPQCCASWFVYTVKNLWAISCLFFAGRPRRPPTLRELLCICSEACLILFYLILCSEASGEFILFYFILSYLILLYLILFYLILSYHILSYLILIYFALFCFILLCFYFTLFLFYFVLFYLYFILCLFCSILFCFYSILLLYYIYWIFVQAVKK